MGGELVTQQTSPISIPQIFEKACPYYISIGMSYEDFWYGDSQKAVYYRKAKEYRDSEINKQLWLQGAYIYEALIDVAPIYHTFAKRGTKPRPYTREPYVVNKHDEEVKREQEKKKMDVQLERMKARMSAINKRFRQKGVTDNGIQQDIHK